MGGFVYKIPDITNSISQSLGTSLNPAFTVQHSESSAFPPLPPLCSAHTRFVPCRSVDTRGMLAGTIGFGFCLFDFFGCGD